MQNTQFITALQAIAKSTSSAQQTKFVNKVHYLVQDSVVTATNNGNFNATTKIVCNDVNTIRLIADVKDVLHSKIEDFYIKLGYFTDVTFTTDNACTLIIELSWDPEAYLDDMSLNNSELSKASLSAIQKLSTV